MLLSSCAAPRSWTPQEKGVLAWSILASGADLYTTTRALDYPGNYEINPTIGRNPSNERVAAFLISSELLTIIFCHYYPDFRLPFLSSKAMVNTGFALHNSTLDRGN